MPFAPSAVHFLACSVAMGIAMLVAFEVGRRRGQQKALTDPDGADKGTGALEGAVFALFGLLLAFTFSSAIGRFSERRELITAEANAIGTAYLRLDLLPPAEAQRLRDAFRRYVEVRLQAHHEGSVDDLSDTLALQQEIWSGVIAAVRDHSERSVAIAVMNPVNEMIDLTSERWMASRAHPPWIIFALLVALACATAWLAGHAMGVVQRRHWQHALAFAISTCCVFYVILELEFPRAGLIRVDRADSVLQLLLDQMDPPQPSRGEAP